MSKINITIVSTAKHGDLRKVVQHYGSQSEAARQLGVDIPTFGEWCNLKGSPPISEDALSRSFTWTQERLDELERKLFPITGKTLEQMFPKAMRDNKAWLKASKQSETTGEIETAAILEYGANVAARMAAPNPHDEAESGELKELISGLLGELSDSQASILRMRFGIGCDPMRLEQVGKVMGIGKERVRQIEAKAVRLLQNVDRTRRIVDYAPPQGILQYPVAEPDERTLTERYSQRNQA